MSYLNIHYSIISIIILVVLHSTIISIYANNNKTNTPASTTHNNPIIYTISQKIIPKFLLIPKKTIPAIPKIEEKQNDSHLSHNTQTIHNNNNNTFGIINVGDQGLFENNYASQYVLNTSHANSSSGMYYPINKYGCFLVAITRIYNNILKTHIDAIAMNAMEEIYSTAPKQEYYISMHNFAQLLQQKTNMNVVNYHYDTNWRSQLLQYTKPHNKYIYILLKLAVKRNNNGKISNYLHFINLASIDIAHNKIYAIDSSNIGRNQFALDTGINITKQKHKKQIYTSTITGIRILELSL